MTLTFCFVNTFLDVIMLRFVLFIMFYHKCCTDGTLSGPKFDFLIICRNKQFFLGFSEVMQKCMTTFPVH